MKKSFIQIFLAVAISKYLDENKRFFMRKIIFMKSLFFNIYRLSETQSMASFPAYQGDRDGHSQ